MAFKFVALCALLAVANAGYVAPVTYAAAAPVHTKVVNPSVDAVASTQQNVVRSFGGTVSHYSKSVDTPYSSVRKVDTRINNNVYTPAVAKTVTYAAPAVTKTVAAPTAAVYSHGSPVVYSHQIPSYAPALSKTVYSHDSPAVYSHQSPAVYAAPAVTKTVYSHDYPAVYSHQAPAVYATPGVSKTVYSHESPAVYSHSAPAFYAAPAVAKAVNYAAPTATTSFNHGPTATTYAHNAPGVTGYGTSQTVHYSPAEMVSHMSFDGFGTHWGY